ncbi:hypothetical protein CKO50_09090 [Pseudoalteromonas sp. HM-SA03]|uniref:hypothetical protein n=1 Tax=Pseudoalteromonas sp. HM-SA03 TaxID=2029678 RepID=UPI000BAE4B64|nr:hypothetical protein [Pseudoalteromonas sp. HM-SA03]PAY01693.1 hypothetical protein CKO50_09090 [Pseudoalteromonas sp. HM-SA03]
MHLKLNKKKIKTLSKDKQAIPHAQTPAIAGGLSNEVDCDTYSHGGCCGTVDHTIIHCSAACQH